jgi:hypothetical protein
MSDSLPPKRSLSEISHLFLSSVRDKQTNGAPRPRRVPPRKLENGNEEMTIDLTPDEFAHVFGSGGPAKPQEQGIQVTAVLGAHLNGEQFDRVKEYARHLAASAGRVGLIELDASEFRVMCFERASDAMDLDRPEPMEVEEPRQMAEALREMSFDVQRWLLLVPSLRTPEAKALLRAVDHWVLLSTTDHDGVVASYRMLKGLADSHRPRLSLALLDAIEEAEVDRVYRKLAGVCQQFLNWNLEAEPPVRNASRISEHLVLCSRPIREKAQLAAAPQWSVVTEFLSGAKAAGGDDQSEPNQNEDPQSMTHHDQASSELEEQMPRTPTATSQTIEHASPQAETSAPSPAPLPAASMRLVPAQASTPVTDDVAEVLDLVSDDAESILGAVLKQNGELIECPVRPPMCVEARLAIARDRGIVLLAVSRQGLSELRNIGLAYRWVTENRQLLAMALPQFALDVQRQPRLRLLVDHADSRADVLQPMLGSEHFSVQSYRRLRWGAKMGLFLEAA